MWPNITNFGSFFQVYLFIIITIFHLMMFLSVIVNNVSHQNKQWKVNDKE